MQGTARATFWRIGACATDGKSIQLTAADRESKPTLGSDWRNALRTGVHLQAGPPAGFLGLKLRQMLPGLMERGSCRLKSAVSSMAPCRGPCPHRAGSGCGWYGLAEISPVSTPGAAGHKKTAPAGIDVPPAPPDAACAFASYRRRLRRFGTGTPPAGCGLRINPRVTSPRWREFARASGPCPRRQDRPEPCCSHRDLAAHRSLAGSAAWSGDRRWVAAR